MEQHGERRAARTVPRLRAVAAGIVLLATLVAACGSPAPSASRPSPTPDLVASTGTPTPSNSPAPSTSPAPVPTPSPTPTPTPSPTASTTPHLDAALAATLQQTLDGLRVSGKYVGMTAAVVFPDGSTWTGASGLAVASPARKATTETIFSIGSITKTFVAALTLRLAGEGSLRLDDPLSRYVPSFPNAAHITLRQLLSHTSGIQDLFNAPGMSAAILADPSRRWTPAQVLARIGKPYFAPGKGYHYSNTNYVLLGLVLEKVTGKRLGAVLQSEFLGPLGLTHTFFQNYRPPTGGLAHGYRGTAAKPRDVSAGAKLLPFESEVTTAGAAGDGASDVIDVARWASALYGGEVLTPDELASMLDVSLTAPFKPAYPYGLGAEQCVLAGHLAWGHRGHLDGYWASMAYLPDVRLTVVVMTNVQWADPLAPSAKLVTAVLGPVTPAPRPSVSPLPSASPVS